MGAIERVDPAEAGLNAERLKRIPAYFDTYIQKQKLPCVAALVARGGQVAKLQAGLRDNELSVLFLMRLVPVDLRDSAFPVGRCIRAPLNHMQAILTRTAPDAFEVMVFRSMGRTAWGELAEALEVLEAVQG